MIRSRSLLFFRPTLFTAQKAHSLAESGLFFMAYGAFLFPAALYKYINKV